MRLPDLEENINSIIKDSFGQPQQKVTWDPSFILESISLPEVIQSTTITKKMKIQIMYKDKNGISRTKTIFFGHGDQYVFSNDNNLRMKRLNSQRINKNKDDIFAPQYWECILLQRTQDFVGNVIHVIKPQLQEVWNKARQTCLIPKKPTSRGKNFKNFNDL